ncbi:MAG TPA: glycosyltransferase family 39 protein [Miltoncostaeaceae bacterium]|nr:glycosyltransferase family 39 protein [Miltoncostaeaceae bacterium]
MRRAPFLLALAGVVAAGLALRLWAFAGVTAAHLGDDTRYVAVARNLANGHPPEGEAEWFGGRVAFLWPVAGLFRVLWADDRTAVAWPLAASLLAIVAAGLLGREIGGAAVGLTAAALVAVAPLEVLMATRLRPDAVMPALVALAVWAALRSGRSPGRATAWAAAAGALIVLAWSAREMALLAVPVLVAAAWRPSPRSLVAGVAGGIALAAGLVAAAAAVGADPLLPLTGTAGASAVRNPLAAWRWDDGQLGWLARGALDPGHPAFGLAPVVLVALALLARRRDRRALLPAAWALGGLAYLEVPALANLSPSPRFLLALSVPAALLVALAAAGRTRPAARAVMAPAAVALAAVAAVTALAPVPAREHRAEDVVLLDRVVARLRALPPGPVLAEDHTWWLKARLFLARDRLPVPRADDPAFLDAAARARRGRLEPLPRVGAYRGGYVLLGPVTPRAGWPRNWGEMRRRIRAEVPWDALVPVAQEGEVRILRWPPGAGARPPRAAEPGTG